MDNNKTPIRFNGKLKELLNCAKRGKSVDIDYIMAHLDKKCDLPTTRFVDFALSQVNTPEGIKRMEHYLFKGSQIQRNYCSLYFNRKLEWKIVKKAYELGLIDELQAYSR